MILPKELSTWSDARVNRYIAVALGWTSECIDDDEGCQG